MTRETLFVQQILQQKEEIRKIREKEKSMFSGIIRRRKYFL